METKSVPKQTVVDALVAVTGLTPESCIEILGKVSLHRDEAKTRIREIDAQIDQLKNDKADWRAKLDAAEVALIKTADEVEEPVEPQIEPEGVQVEAADEEIK